LRTVYASIVQTNDVDLNKSKIICITSGTKCINGEYMSLNGSTINDSHAEILACRLLKKYLYETLDLYIDYSTGHKVAIVGSTFDIVLTSVNFETGFVSLLEGEEMDEIWETRGLGQKDLDKGLNTHKRTKYTH
jgi:hypothetical protein